MTPLLTDNESRQLREALRTTARLLVIDLERRGIVLRLSPAGKIQGPRHLLTDLDRWAVREHAEAIKVLLRYRSHWCAWPQPVRRFDPRTAFDAVTPTSRTA